MNLRKIKDSQQLGVSKSASRESKYKNEEISDSGSWESELKKLWDAKTIFVGTDEWRKEAIHDHGEDYPDLVKDEISSYKGIAYDVNNQWTEYSEKGIKFVFGTFGEKYWSPLPGESYHTASFTVKDGIVVDVEDWDYTDVFDSGEFTIGEETYLVSELLGMKIPVTPKEFIDGFVNHMYVA